MSSYPKWLYHPTEKARIVADEAEHKALGAGWVESPVDVLPERPGKTDVEAGIKEAADTLAAIMKPSEDSPIGRLLTPKLTKKGK